MASITLQKDMIVLVTPFELKDVCKSIPGARWDKRNRVWTLPAGSMSAAETIAAFERAQVSIRIDPSIEALATAKPRISDDPIPKSHTRRRLYDPITKSHEGDFPAWPVQRQAFWRSMSAYQNSASAGIGLDMAMGRGKSKVIIDLIQNLDLVNVEAPLVLIVAPKGVIDVWPLQILDHAVRLDEWDLLVLGEKERPGIVYVDIDNDGELIQGAPQWWSFEHRSVARRAETFRKWVTLSTRKYRVVIVNIESMWQGKLGEALHATNWSFMAADEVHRLKSPRGDASKWASRLSRLTPRRAGASGTMMPNSPLDAFGVGRFIDRSVFGDSVTLFRNRYLYTNPVIPRAIDLNPTTGDWFLGDRERKEFERRWGSIIFRAEKDLAGLPELLPMQYRYAKPEKNTRKIYAELEAEMIARVRERLTRDGERQSFEAVVSSANAMVLTTRLQQVTSGFVRAEVEPDDSDDPFAFCQDEESTEWIDQAKSKLLAEVLEDIDPKEKVVVFCRFTEDLRAVRAATEKLNRRYGEVSGRIKQVRGKWLATDPFEILGVQTQSGSLGVDYTVSCFEIFYSVWGLGDFLQARDRLHRPGQTRPVTPIALVTEKITDKLAVDELLIRKILARDKKLTRLARGAHEAAMLDVISEIVEGEK